jgi:uncharacterized protein with PQ loop repeat
VIYYQECIPREIKADGDEAIVLVDQKQLKQRRVSLDKATLLSKVDTNSMENQTTTSNNNNEDNEFIMSMPPKIKPIWVNLVGSTVLITLVFISCYGFMTTQSTPPLDNTAEEIRLLPQISGWCSCGLYVGSRIPQLLKNWREQSTDGLSPGMFICAVIGNLFFALSIFLKSTERRYIIINLSWIIGSLGTVIFDFMVNIHKTHCIIFD